MAGGGIVRVELGWPAKVLNPNSRAHYMQVSIARKAAKKEAYWATKIELPRAWKHDGSRLRLTVIAYPPDKRARDDDNFAASLKSHRDGIADALGLDDKLFDQQPVQFAEPVKNGRVVIGVSQ